MASSRMRWISGGVTAAQGFQAAGVSAGIKRSRKPDLALVFSEEPAIAAGVFTRNRVKAAPVVMSQQRLKRGVARAVLLNSGCANCLTGEAGMQDALMLARLVARELHVRERDVLVASTGVIGRRLPVPRMQRAIPRLVQQTSRRGHQAAALAILTTDVRVKEVAVEARIGGRVCRVGGMAKGAGMIAPSMATMLSVLTTDVAIASGPLRTILQEVTERTFNRISVDGDMSTNDTVFALASGRSGVTIRAGTPSLEPFTQMVQAVAEALAKLIVKDGEGATRIMEVEVLGARNEQDAQACARQICNSPLVKTMVAGGDPNVGRIAAAAGASGAQFDADQLEITIGNQPVVARGEALRLPKSVSRSLWLPPEVTVRIHLHAGRAQARMLTCDLTEDYVRINARYST